MTKWVTIHNPGGMADGMNALTWNRRTCSGGGLVTPQGGSGSLPGDWGDNGPDGIGGLDGVVFANCDWYQLTNANFYCDFTAPFSMIISKIRTTARQDIPSGAALTWGGHWKIYVNGRVKRVHGSVGHLRDDSWEIVRGDGLWHTETYGMRPLVIPKGAAVTIEVYMGIGGLAGFSWMRTNLEIGYRAPTELAYNFNAKSWLTSRTETLPKDLMTLSVKGTDAEGTDVTGYPLNGWHGVAGSVPLGQIILASLTPFPSFSTLSSEGTESLLFTSDDGDGPDGNWLGLGRTYTDDALTEVDNPPAGSLGTLRLPAIVNSFNVRKRTPLLTLNSMGIFLKLGDLIHFKGTVVDPDQSTMLDFISGLPVNILRDLVGVNSGFCIADGTFDVIRTLALDDKGQHSVQAQTSSSDQYNAVGSTTRQIFVGEEVASALKLELGKLLPWHSGERGLFNITISGLPAAILAGQTVVLEKMDGTWTSVRTGQTDANGVVSVSSDVLTSGSIRFRAEYSGFIDTSTYTIYLGATSPETSVDVTGALTRLTITVNKPSLSLGGDVAFTGTLTDATTGAPLGGMPIEVQQLQAGQWTKVDTATTDAQGTFSITHKPSDIGTFSYRAYFAGSDSQYGVANSDTVSVDVRSVTGTTPGTSRISITLTAEQSATVGEPVQLSGDVSIVFIRRGLPVPKAEIALLKDGKEITKTATDLFGKFTFTWTPDQTGFFEMSTVLITRLAGRKVAESNHVVIEVV